MMHRIKISPSSHDLLVARAAHQGKVMRSGRRLPDGRFEIEVDDEVMVALEAIAPGDPDEALRIMSTTGVGHA
jgi:hypothetical protein